MYKTKEIIEFIKSVDVSVADVLIGGMPVPRLGLGRQVGHTTAVQRFCSQFDGEVWVITNRTSFEQHYRHLSNAVIKPTTETRYIIFDSVNPIKYLPLVVDKTRLDLPNSNGIRICCVGEY